MKRKSTHVKRMRQAKSMVSMPMFRKRVHKSKKSDYDRNDKSWKNHE